MVRPEGLDRMENNDLIGNRTRDISACSIRQATYYFPVIENNAKQNKHNKYLLRAFIKHALNNFIRKMPLRLVG
jgi:hypothetical protein